MLGNLKREWRALRGGKPGHRFQDRFDRSRKTRASQSWVRRLIQPAVAILCLAIGVILTVLPGPAIVFYFVAAGLLAGESRPLARVLDWSEILGRKVVRKIKGWWSRASLIVKSTAVLVGAGALCAMAFAAYHMFLGMKT